MQEKIDSDTMARYWDEQAATFDDEPDHGLRDPAVRQAWAHLLLPLLPASPCSVIDLGCGTGTLSLLLAAAGHHVRGLDLSDQMVAAASAKAALAEPGGSMEFRQGDASEPPYPEASADVVLVRHVLWAMADPDGAVARWIRLLKPDGILVLVEGRWETGGGITAEDCLSIVDRHCAVTELTRLNDDELWGQTISDDRYLVVARLG